MKPIVSEPSSIFADYSVIMAMVAGAVCAIMTAYFWLMKKPMCRNPFTEDHVKNPGPIETNQKKREQILRQGFTPDKVPRNLDAIVIGSGIGGLACAGIMARAGKKVLVLEQHDRAGGCTHTYEEKGFEFDIGLHYIGQVHDGSLNNTMMDVLSDGQIVWETLGKEFDTVAIKQSDGSHKLFTLKSGKGEFEKRLIEMFPDEEKAILEYSRLVRGCSKSVLSYVSLKLMPKWFIRLLIKLNLFNWWTKGYEDLTKETLQEVMDRLTDNKELKVVLSYSFGDYGTIPAKVPFFMHGMLTYHFYHDCYYPRGGASEIAFNFIPGILRPGGNVLVRAPVSSILFEGKRAVGVRVSKGGNDHDIYAPLIISNAGAINTFGKLIPSSKALELGLKPKHTKLESGLACSQVLVGLRGSAEELGITQRNYWIHDSTDPNKSVNDYLSMAREDAANERIPILFVSFPSTKDSTWNSKHPGKSVCVIVTFSNWEWFAEWKNERVMKRGPVYNNLKRAFQDQVWNQFLEIHPQLKDKVEFIDSGTPISHRYYIDSPRGEIYGLDHATERFQHDIAMDLRPKTDVEGLYLTGQDVMTGGITAAAMGGLMTAVVVLGRDVFTDLIELMKSRKKRIKKKMD